MTTNYSRMYVIMNVKINTCLEGFYFLEFRGIVAEGVREIFHWSDERHDLICCERERKRDDCMLEWAYHTVEECFPDPFASLPSNKERICNACKPENCSKVFL